jgi:hypothetical protein
MAKHSPEFKAAREQMKRVRKVSAKGVTRQEITTVVSPRPKLKPRGKPFQKGNTLSLPYRFVKGQSGNPGGRPKVAKLNQALRDGMAMDSSEPLPMRTNAEVMAARVINQAKRGNIVAIREAGDRAEGRPHQSVSIEERENPFTELVAGMNRMSAHLGPPPDDSGPLFSEEKNADDSGATEAE